MWACAIKLHPPLLFQHCAKLLCRWQPLSRREEASARGAELRVKGLSRALLGCRVSSEIDALRITAARPSSCMSPGQLMALAGDLEFAVNSNFGNDGNGSPVHPCPHQN